MQISNFLKRVLILDAASCLIMGAGLWPAAGALAGALGLPPALIAGAGMALLPLGLFILWLGARAAAPAALVWLVIVGNLAWAGESLLLVFSREGITPLGTAFVAVQGAAVLGLALLEYVGVKRSRAAAAR